jgi:hypothetical protein
MPAPDGLVLRMHRAYDRPVPCADYDRLLVCFNLPEETVMTLTRGDRRRPAHPHAPPPPAPPAARRGLNSPGAARDPHAHHRGAHARTARAGSGWMLWIGLQHAGRLKSHLGQWAGYDEQWDKYLQPPDFEPTFQPAFGMMINARRTRRRARGVRRLARHRELRLLAERARAQRPEAMIGENLNFWSTNVFRRERDIGKMLSLHGSNAAQAGLLWQDKALCRLAARFALSLVHCEHWEDIFFAHMRGSVWDQRGFVQSIGAWDCAVILDLCGEWFTPLGRQLVLRRLATEAHGAMCQASWWWEYMYYTNQMAWISPARIYSLLVLEQHMPLQP